MKIPEYAVHTEQAIKGFFGQFRWLSNFFGCNVIYENVLYPSAENAYQASKIIPEYRYNLLTCSASKSKKEWKKYPVIEDLSKNWDRIKYDIMGIIVVDKFTRNEYLKEKLKNTGTKFLEETNDWYDIDFGVCNKIGKNMLGKILMHIRNKIKETNSRDDLLESLSLFIRDECQNLQNHK